MDIQFGKAIRALRKQRKLKLKDIHGLSIPYLSDLERGRVNPSLKTLSKIAQNFDMRLSDFIFCCEEFEDDE